MSSFQLRTRRAALCSVVLSAAASTVVLGATAGLFSASGRTPTFAAGSSLAALAEHCPSTLSQARHECLREILARDAGAQGHMLVARFGD